MPENTDDLRVRRIEALTPPAQILREFAITPKAKNGYGFCCSVFLRSA
jgi:hypothetical protein